MESFVSRWQNPEGTNLWVWPHKFGSTGWCHWRNVDCLFFWTQVLTWEWGPRTVANAECVDPPHAGNRGWRWSVIDPGCLQTRLCSTVRSAAGCLCLYSVSAGRAALRDANLYISQPPIGQSGWRPELPLVLGCLQAAVTQTTGGPSLQSRVCRAAICSHLGERRRLACSAAAGVWSPWLRDNLVTRISHSPRIVSLSLAP